VHKFRSPQKKKKLRKSHKSNKKIHPQSFLVPVINQLRQNKLSNLNLANRSLLDKDLKNLVPLITKATNLKRIILKNNNLTDKSVEQICSAIRNVPVEILDFSFNRISPACFTHFRKLTNYNNYLKYILIKNNDIPNSIKIKKTNEFKKLGIKFD
jgi:Ran GTPase-activating protein (RanGAP) involved in mRNA processing and transport